MHTWPQQDHTMSDPSLLTLHKKPIYIPTILFGRDTFVALLVSHLVQGFYDKVCWPNRLVSNKLELYLQQSDNQTTTLLQALLLHHHVFIGTNFANSVHDTCRTPRWWRCTYTIGMKGNGYTIGLKGNVGRCRTDAGRHICQWEQLVVLMIFQQ